MQRAPYETANHEPAAVISVRGEATLLVDPEVADLTVVISAHARDRREAHAAGFATREA